MMNRDRITKLRVAGLRSLADVELKLPGLTVLIGENGAGKSALVEAFELLRYAPKPLVFLHDVVARIHGGLASLLRHGASELSLRITIEGAGPRLEYELVLGNQGGSPTVVSESILVFAADAPPEGSRALSRRGTKGEVFQVPHVPSAEVGKEHLGEAIVVHELALALPMLIPRERSDFDRVIAALSGIELHVPFETRPLWQQAAFATRQGPRWPSPVERADAVERYGLNLPNAFQELRNRGGAAWERILDQVRLGLGDDVREIQLQAAGRGNLELGVLFGAFPNKLVPAETLSEGQLAYLAFVALCELDANRTLLAFDEPEVHLHPALLTRVAWMLEAAAERAPVVLATHSDRLLDALQDPASQVVLCELDEHRATQVRYPNRERLASWMERYRGIGSIRAEGYEAHVFDRPGGGR